MGAWTARFVSPLLCYGALLLSCLAMPVAGLAVAGSAHAQEAGDEMIVRRIGLIDLEGVLRASKGTAKVRDLLDNQRKLFQQEFAEREADLQKTERELMTQRELLSEDAFAERLSQFEADVATIQKQAPDSLGAACKEAMTDSDKYIMEIHDAMLPIEQRVNLLATTMLMDFMFFEQDNGMCGCQDGKLRITCCETYCYGCLCPCNIVLGGQNNEGGH